MIAEEMICPYYSVIQQLKIQRRHVYVRDVQYRLVHCVTVHILTITAQQYGKSTDKASASICLGHSPLLLRQATGNSQSHTVHISITARFVHPKRGGANAN